MGFSRRKPISIGLPSTEDFVRELIDEPDKWLDTENDQLGGERPRDLLGTSKEAVLRNLLEAVGDGSFS